MQDLIIGCIPLLIAFLVSLIYYKKLEPTWLRLFTWFLLASFLIQIIEYVYSFIHRGEGIEKQSNLFIFNYYVFIECEFYILIFYKALYRKTFKKILLYIGLFFVIFFIYETFFVKHYLNYSTLTVITANFIIITCCIIYLAELLMAEEFIVFFSMPMFWITTGIMIFSVGIFLYLAFFHYIFKNKLDPDGVIYGIIATSLSILQYSFFTIGFSCKTLWKKIK